MRYALVDGQRYEAAVGLRGICHACGLPMIPRCGQQRVHHWAHRTANCDEWWERETAWHRDWKNEFPQHCQEVRVNGQSGDFHIADVRMPNGTVLEFQHSHLSTIERNVREAFYGPMAWIVDGMRNKNDLKTLGGFLTATNPDYHGVSRGWPLQFRRFPLVDHWISAVRPVYLDFGNTNFINWGLPPIRLLWHLSKNAHSLRIVLTPFSRQNVIDHFTNGAPLEGVRARYRPAVVPQDYRPPDWM